MKNVFDVQYLSILFFLMSTPHILYSRQLKQKAEVNIISLWLMVAVIVWILLSNDFLTARSSKTKHN